MRTVCTFCGTLALLPEILRVLLINFEACIMKIILIKMSLFGTLVNVNVLCIWADLLDIFALKNDIEESELISISFVTFRFFYED